MSITVNAGERFNVQKRDEWEQGAAMYGRPAVAGTFRGWQGVEVSYFQSCQ